LVVVLWLGIISLVGVALRFFFVKIDCETAIRSMVSKFLEAKCVGNEGPVGRDLTKSRAMVVISLSHLI
jgi:hypothetical protein